jgi:hypothetical protein
MSISKQTSESKRCQHCGKDPCCCSNNNQNQNNPSNTFNPTFNSTINPMFNSTINVKVDCPFEKRKKQQKKCECSGRVNFQTDFLTLIADICPSCNIQGSFVSFTANSTETSINFTSSFVNFPRCTLIDTGTILNTAGFGTLVVDGSIIQNATFTLNLFETSDGDDLLNFIVTGFDQNGNSILLLLIFPTVPDEDLMINFCNACSCPLSSSQTANVTPELHKIPEGLNKGKIVIMKNGQVEVKEL